MAVLNASPNGEPSGDIRAERPVQGDLMVLRKTLTSPHGGQFYLGPLLLLHAPKEHNLEIGSPMNQERTMAGDRERQPTTNKTHSTAHMTTLLMPYCLLDKNSPVVERGRTLICSSDWCACLSNTCLIVAANLTPPTSSTRTSTIELKAILYPNN